MVECGTGLRDIALCLQDVLIILPIELGFSLFVHAHSRRVVNNVARQDRLRAVHHEERCISGFAIGRGPQPPEYEIEFLNPVLV